MNKTIFTTIVLCIIISFINIIVAISYKDKIYNNKKEAKEKAYIEGYIKGSYETLKNDTLLLKFVETYDLTPDQQRLMFDIVNFSATVNSQLGIFFPDLIIRDERIDQELVANIQTSSGS